MTLQEFFETLQTAISGLSLLPDTRIDFRDISGKNFQIGSCYVATRKGRPAIIIQEGNRENGNGD